MFSYYKKTQHFCINKMKLMQLIEAINNINNQNLLKNQTIVLARQN